MLAPSVLALAALVGQAPPEPEPAPAAPAAPSATGEPALELVVLPPKPEDGIKPDVAMQIWKLVVGEVEKAHGSLGVSVKLQTDAKTALAGPARDQAWECRGEIPCLVELGNTLGAGLLVAGTVDKEGVGFLVIDVRTSKKVVGAKSSKKMEKAGWQRQAKAAAKGVLGGVDTWRKSPPKEAPPPEPALDPNTAQIKIASGELSGVKELTIDGVPLPIASPDGVSWSGAPGKHVVVATRTDGTRAVHELTLEGGRATPLVLVFVEPPVAAASPPPPQASPRASSAVVGEAPPPAERDRGEDATSQWWFWVSLGVAVAAGGTTAAVLAGGIKGSVATDSGRGSVTGSY